MNEESSPPGVASPSPAPGQWSPAPDVPRPGNVCPLSLAAGWCCPEHGKHAESDSEAKYIQIDADYIIVKIKVQGIRLNVTKHLLKITKILGNKTTFTWKVMKGNDFNLIWNLIYLVTEGFLLIILHCLKTYNIILPLLHNCLLKKLTFWLALSINLPCTLIAISQDCEEHILIHFCLSSSRKTKRSCVSALWPPK